MTTITIRDSKHAAGSHRVRSELITNRLAEAACYAVLQRIGPVLRHNVAGLMQPVSMLMVVLQRRVQMPEPDLPAITKNVTSVSALAKEATAGCMSVMGWIASREDANVSLRTSVNEAAALLAMELSAHGLEISNTISSDAVTVPQSFFRSVLVGALLAFCDQRIAGSTLQISLNTEAGNGSTTNQLTLRMLPGHAPAVPDVSGIPDWTEPPAVDRPVRHIDWSDVEAMAGLFGVTVTRGAGYLAVGLPTTS